MKCPLDGGQSLVFCAEFERISRFWGNSEEWEEEVSRNSISANLGRRDLISIQNLFLPQPVQACQSLDMFLTLDTFLISLLGIHPLTVVQNDKRT